MARASISSRLRRSRTWTSFDGFECSILRVDWLDMVQELENGVGGWSRCQALKLNTAEIRKANSGDTTIA